MQKKQEKKIKNQKNTYAKKAENKFLKNQAKKKSRK